MKRTYENKEEMTTTVPVLGGPLDGGSITQSGDLQKELTLKADTKDEDGAKFLYELYEIAPMDSTEPPVTAYVFVGDLADEVDDVEEGESE